MKNTEAFSDSMAQNFLVVFFRLFVLGRLLVLLSSLLDN
jgi:hypothetical protein